MSGVRAAERSCRILNALPVRCGRAGASRHPGLPVFSEAPRVSRSGPTCLPAEPGCLSSMTLLPSGLPSALLSRKSSPHAVPSSRKTPLFPKSHFKDQPKSHFPWGLSRPPTARVPTEPTLPVSRLVALAKAYQAASPLGACSPKKVICLVPVCLPCFSQGLALSRHSTEMWGPRLDAPTRHAGKMTQRPQNAGLSPGLATAGT